MSDEQRWRLGDIMLDREQIYAFYRLLDNATREDVEPVARLWFNAFIDALRHAECDVSVHNPIANTARQAMHNDTKAMAVFFGGNALMPFDAWADSVLADEPRRRLVLGIRMMGPAKLDMLMTALRKTRESPR